MPTQAVPAPQRIWEIGTPSTEPPPPAHGPAAGRVTAVAAMLFAGSGAVSGRLIDASGGVEVIAAFASRSVTVVAGAVALIGGVVVLAQAARRLRRRAARWATALGRAGSPSRGSSPPRSPTPSTSRICPARRGVQTSNSARPRGRDAPG